MTRVLAPKSLRTRGFSPPFDGGLRIADHDRAWQARKPCIRALGVTVCDVLEYLASGMTQDELLAEFRDLERDDIRACLAFAADRERRLFVVPAA